MTLDRPNILPIVEGTGDRYAAPVLLRRVLRERMRRYDVGILRPMVTKGRGRLVNRLEDFLRYARREPGCSAVLVLLDADDDCPKELGIRLAIRAANAPPMATAVVCAKPQYKNWFLPSESYDGEVEGLRNAKSWLTSRMPPGRVYKETANQASLSDSMDLEATFRASRSFQRLCHALEELVASVDGGHAGVTPAA